MSTFYSCEGNLTVSAEGALQCDNWVTVSMTEIETSIIAQFDYLFGWDTDVYLMVMASNLAFFITSVGAGMVARTLARR
ncbi:hypothetical protein KOI40_03070 [Aestuariicella sp. G3-2]|uniref:hypothetical protein n=1 Tax=Pseudomaricurvus albidus TaxID=2842452 RepID=UPI001C0C2F32|nr:hypothetical protein [Aestuariicella albida]MBU3068783.1 hypothetical protein [Aestuariicella albida]